MRYAALLVLVMQLLSTQKSTAQNIYHADLHPHWASDSIFTGINRQYDQLYAFLVELAANFVVYDHEKPLAARFFHLLEQGHQEKVARYLRSTPIQNMFANNEIETSFIDSLARRMQRLRNKIHLVSLTTWRLEVLSKGRKYHYGNGHPKRQVAQIDWKDGEKILDIGSGHYLIGKLIGRKVSNAHIYYNDIDSISLQGIGYATQHDKQFRKARIKNNNEFFLVMGSEIQTGAEEIIFDKILIRQTFHHFNQPRKILESIKKSMGTHTRLYIIEYNDKDDDYLGCNKQLTHHEFDLLLREAGLREIRSKKIDSQGGLQWTLYEYQL